MTDLTSTPRADLSRVIRLRALGDNLRFTRIQWLELADELREGSELRQRILGRLTTDRAEEIREAVGCSWESACARAELEHVLSTTDRTL